MGKNILHYHKRLITTMQITCHLVLKTVTLGLTKH